MNFTKEFFELRGEIPPKQAKILQILGLFSILSLWYLFSLQIANASLLPNPLKVLISFKELHFENGLINNSLFSIKLNLLGYFEAIAIALPLGFLIGLFPVARTIMDRYIQAIRFLPLTAMTGLFIAYFGIQTNMKVQFLAFGIFVYLLPVVIQRIDEVENIYMQTAQTLGATRWQIIKSVFIPSVLSRVSDDIRVLVAISWTYIIIAELVNNQGGIGAMAYKFARNGRIDKVFAVLLVIILIGMIQDRIFKYLDRKLFKFKYV